MSPERRDGALFALAVLAILALAAWVRLDGAGAKALWYDEVCSVLRADGRFLYAPVPYGEPVPKIPVEIGPRRGLDKVVDARGDNHPPLYFLLLRFWKDAFGGSEGALRALSGLFSLGTVLAGGALGHIWAGRRGALLAMLLLAVSPFEVYYARDARSYSLLGLCTLASVLALARLEDEARPPGERARGALWALYAAATAAGLATHYVGVVAPAAQVGYWLARRRPASLAKLPAALGAAAVLLLPLSGLVAKHLWFTIGSPAGALSFTHRAQGDRDVRLGARAEVPANAARLALTLASGESAPLAATVLGGGAVLAAAVLGARGKARLAGAVALAAPALLVAIDLAFGSNRLATARYAFASTGALQVAAAVGLAGLRPALAGPALAAIATAASLGIAADRASASKGIDFRGAARVMNAAGCDRGDLVVLLLQFGEQAIELNPHVAGEPDEVVVADRLPSDAIASPRYRDVWLLAIPSRRKAAEQIRAGIATILPEADARDLDGLLLVRFSRRPR